VPRFLCDTNVWLALAISKHSHREVARGWFDSIDASESALFCRATQQSFLRLMTNASLFRQFGSVPLNNEQARLAYEALLADHRVIFDSREPASLEQKWREFAAGRAPSPKIWMDAYLAALALGLGWTLVTIDKDFRQFPGLDLLLLAD
jgi:toxin-antitoxin system PIN domain toxin